MYKGKLQKLIDEKRFNLMFFPLNYRLEKGERGCLASPGPSELEVVAAETKEELGKLPEIAKEYGLDFPILLNTSLYKHRVWIL